MSKTVFIEMQSILFRVGLHICKYVIRYTVAITEKMIVSDTLLNIY